MLFELPASAVGLPNRIAAFNELKRPRFAVRQHRICAAKQQILKTLTARSRHHTVDAFGNHLPELKA